MKNKLIIAFGVIAWLFTAIMALQFSLSANIPFWYDPARDMLSAWATLSKITLIGPTSGIPGFFYGPYWIWWLSFGLLFSKNPAIVTIITTTIPYLFVFAGTLFLFSKLFGKVTSILLWLLFFLSFQSYMTQLWNPYLAPILYLSGIYILVFHVQKVKNLASLLPLFISGIICGLALNIHISFSVGFTIGCLFYAVITSFLQKGKIISKMQQVLVSIGSFILGVVIMFVPFFLFEVRHGFMQTKVALTAFLHGGDVVLLHGFSKPEIIQQFFLRFSQLIGVPFLVSMGVLIVLLAAYVFVIWKYKQTLSSEEKKLLVILLSITFGVLGVYLIAKNPIWDYHFDGTEVLWLLFLGVVLSRVKYLRYILFVWVIFLAGIFSFGVFASYQVNPLTRGSLYTKEYIVKTIQEDAGQHQYTVYAYSPSIYTYDYSYLFKWMAKKEFSYDPGQVERQGNIYLILPPAKQSALTDFIHFHTPDTLYKTKNQWKIPDGTIILKRVALSNKTN